MTADDREAHRYALTHIAFYFLAFCAGVAFALIVGGYGMTIRAHLDDQFACQFGGLPPIAPPVSLSDAEAQHEAENGLFAEESNDEQ